MNADFEAVSRILFEGDVSPNGLCFVGLEGAAQCDDEELARCRATQSWHRDVPPGAIAEARARLGHRRYTKVYEIMAKLIVQSGLATGFRDHEHEAYLVQRLFQPGSKVSQANLFPLGKPRFNNDIPSSTRDLLGLGDVTPAAYKEFVQQHRFPELRKRWAEINPQLTICFGKGSRSDFEQAFGVDAAIAECVGPFLVYEAERPIVITPFFKYTLMGGDSIRELATLARRKITSRLE